MCFLSYLGVSFFVAGAVFGEVAVAVSLVVAGAVFREVATCCNVIFVAGAIFGCWRLEGDSCVAPLLVLEVSCVAANKHECRSSIVLCSP